MKKRTIIILVGLMVLVAASAFAIGGPCGQISEQLCLPVDLPTHSVPEPASLILMATGAVGLIGLRKKKRSSM
jgi:hypothetical protein